MTRQPFLHTILSDIISSMSFVVSYDGVTDSGNGTWTLNNICNFRHIAPGMTVTIGLLELSVISYDEEANTILLSGSDVDNTITSFTIPGPFFCHGTPTKQETELSKIKNLSIKFPMVYLMEPYKSQIDDSESASIYQRIDATLCFLTQAKVLKESTDDIYYNAITPMRNLMEDVVNAIKSSPLFFTTDQKLEPKYYTNFWVKAINQDGYRMTFSEQLAGVTIQIPLEVYKLESCPCD